MSLAYRSSARGLKPYAVIPASIATKPRKRPVTGNDAVVDMARKARPLVALEACA